MASAMSNKKTRSKRVTAQQIEYFIGFLGQEDNIKLLTMKTNPNKEGEIKKIWETVSLKLNKIAGGSMKSAEEWRRFYIEFKSKTREKARVFLKQQSETGGGENTAKALSSTEEKLMAHIGWVSVTGAPDLPPEIDPSSQSIDETLVPEVSVEVFTDFSQNQMKIYNVANDDILIEENVIPEPISLNNSPNEVSVDSLPSTSKKIITKQKVNKKIRDRRPYASKASMLNASAEKFAESSEKLSEAFKELSDAIKLLATSINNLAEKI